MKLVTFGEGAGRVGVLDGEEIAVLDVPTMREYFERGGADETGRARRARRDAAARADRPEEVLPHRRATSASTRRSRRTSTGRTRSRPWIVFFQNVDAIVGPDEPVVYPEHLTEELDYELELAVVLAQGRQVVLARGGGGLHRRLRDLQRHHRARHPARARCARACSRFCKAIDTFCPLGPWIVTPDEIPDPHDLAMELRVNGEVRQESHSSRMSVTIPEILVELLGARLLGRRRALDRHGLRRRRLQVARGARRRST